MNVNVTLINENCKNRTYIQFMPEQVYINLKLI